MAQLETQLLTTEEVARIFEIKSSTVGDYARRGILPSFKIGRHRRFKRSDIERWIATQTEENRYR